MSLVTYTIPNLINGVSQQPDIVRLPSQCESMVNCYPTLLDFLRRRPATRHVTRLMNVPVSEALVHTINRDDAEQYILVVLPGTLRIFRLNGEEVPVTFEAPADYLATEKVRETTRALTINDYTFLLNTKQEVAMTGETTPQRVPEALVFVKAANYATDYTVTLDGTSFTHTTYKDDNRDTAGLEYTEKNFGDDNMKNSVWKDANRYKLSSTVIATDLLNKINASGTYTATMVQSTLHIKHRDKKDFTAQVSDSRSNTHLSLATKSVQKFTDLPTVAPTGYLCEVKGEQGSTADNYFVRFVGDDPKVAFGQGIWEEAPKPGIPYRLDPATMPHALVREADGTFCFKQLAWKDRVCGDEKSVPTPSFVGRTLASIFFYRNRLGVLARENVILSEAGEFFNFFATTAMALIDSDPIDTAASDDDQAPTLYHAVSFSEGLMLFSDGAQFKLEHPSDTLSIATAAVKPLTSFEASPYVTPVSAGKNIFFVTPRGQYSNIMEYYVQPDTALTDAANVTAHAPRYIPSGVHSLVVSSNEDVLLVLSGNKPSEVCLYKYLWNGTDKLQSAWFKWTFAGDVLGAAFLETQIFLVMSYPDGLYLEVMDVQPGYADKDADFEYLLDRKVFENEVRVLPYDNKGRTTTLIIPYQLPPDAALEVVTRPFGGATPGIVLPVVSISGSSVTVRGNLTKTRVPGGEQHHPAFVCGLRIPSLFTFSKQYVREDKGQQGGQSAILSGRLQLRAFRLFHTRTGFFHVDVTPAYRATSRRTFTGRVMTHGENRFGTLPMLDGIFQIPVLSRSDQVDITLSSDSFLPFHIVNAEWEGLFNIRSTRL